MKLKLYTFFDSAAQAFTQPFCMHNDGLAIRAFQDNVNSDDKNNMSLHPEQFTLFQIAEWDDKSAKLETLKAPKSIAIGVELVNDDKPKYSNTDLQTLQDQLTELLSYQKVKNEIAEMKSYLSEEDQEKVIPTHPDNKEAVSTFLKQQGE